MTVEHQPDLALLDLSITGSSLDAAQRALAEADGPLRRGL